MFMSNFSIILLMHYRAPLVFSDRQYSPWMRKMPFQKIIIPDRIKIKLEAIGTYFTKFSYLQHLSCNFANISHFIPSAPLESLSKMPLVKPPFAHQPKCFVWFSNSKIKKTESALGFLKNVEMSFCSLLPNDRNSQFSSSVVFV